MNYPDEFHYETYEICYVIPNNVLYGINNDIYFVDTPIRAQFENLGELVKNTIFVA